MKKVFLTFFTVLTCILFFAFSANAQEEPEVEPSDENQNSATDYSDWRMQEPDGLGFGLSISGSLFGGHIFYDKNLNIDSQLHVQISSKSTTSGTKSGIFTCASKTTLEVTETLLMASYRRFFSQEAGFYYGLGAGYGTNNLVWQRSGGCSGTGSLTVSSYEYTASGSGVMAFGEIGWQGNEGYYFHIGYQPAVYLTYSDDYDEEKIPPGTLFRSDANKRWKDAKEPSQLSLGWGWFF